MAKESSNNMSFFQHLEAFRKHLIRSAIAVIFFAGKYIVDNTTFGQNLKDQAEKAKIEQVEAGKSNGNSAKKDNSTSSTPAKSSTLRKDDNTLRVQLVTWGGYAPGLYYNEGAEANSFSRYFKDYGFKVDFKVENDLMNALNAWMAGEYDIIVQTADAFPLYTAPADINFFKPKAFMQVDWSRGGDAIIVKRGINTVNDLKGKTVAIAVPSPAQTLLISALEAAGLSYNDVKVIKTSDNLKAAELFRSKDVDAAVVWSPDDILATRDVPGSKVLLTTREQSHIIGDIFFAKESYLRNNRDKVNAFYEGWMKGLAEINGNKSNYNKAAKYLAELNGLSTDDAKGMMENVYWANHGDNMNFFGLNNSYKGQKGADIYNKMARDFVKTGDAEKLAPNWRNVIDTKAIQNGENSLKGGSYAAESSKVFKPATKSEYKSAPLSVKPVSINFPSGKFQLSENAKTIIDLQFAETAKSFANTKIRIEGNTDNVGNRQMNMNLSKKRAESVAAYLTQQYGINRNRFVILGNGPDKPLKGCETNATDACKAKNRRTDFVLIGG